VPTFPAQITLAIEDFDRLVNMIKRDQKLKVAVDLQVQFHDQDLMSYNTIAEIPGTDLKDEIVMVGAHLDSWHVGTGATDNAAGCAAAMEAVRIIKTLGLQPRRTIRIALWTGEEQGLLGAEAHVEKHFGHYPESRSTMRASSAPASAEAATRTASSRRRLIKQPDYEEFSVYFNLDNGTGKIRGIYCQGNTSAARIFKSWLEPLEDLGATTVTLSGTAGTDHMAFDAVGLPGFQFIQDPIEYWTRTHHSNHDVYERIQPDDVKQAATVMAAFVYQAAMMDERFPRKDQPAERLRSGEDER
jgi:Zn-dependent M28 family amino/carboxypeptidase